jgi:hypothetical protein
MQCALLWQFICMLLANLSIFLLSHLGSLRLTFYAVYFWFPLFKSHTWRTVTSLVIFNLISLFWKKIIKLCLRDYHAVCVPIPLPPVSLWMPQPIFMKLGMHLSPSQRRISYTPPISLCVRISPPLLSLLGKEYTCNSRSIVGWYVMTNEQRIGRNSEGSVPGLILCTILASASIDGWKQRRTFLQIKLCLGRDLTRDFPDTKPDS